LALDVVGESVTADVGDVSALAAVVSELVVGGATLVDGASVATLVMGDATLVDGSLVATLVVDWSLVEG